MKDFILALLFSAFILFGASGCPHAQAKEYTLSWIHDGDTITVKMGDKRIKVRLYGKTCRRHPPRHTRQVFCSG